MITSSREEGFSTKQEGSITDGKITTKASSSSTPWLKLKDPRIVRVSRAFGGKDRHSKVCTVKGLRDRRVRLSVPTAIQLYDLQDRLGLNQPSKVVDWLLNAAKDGIDELPPLQMPPGNFSQNNHPMLISHEVGASQHNKEGLKINSIFNLEDPRPNFWNSDPFLRSKSKGIAKETINEKENSTKRNDEEKQEGSTINEGTNAAQIPSNLFPRANNQSSLPGLFNNAMPYGSYYHWEPNSNLSLAHLGSHGLITSQLTDEVPHNFNVVTLPSTLSLPSGSQVLVCPPSATHSYFPPHVTAASVEFDPRQTNHFQMLSSSSQNPLSNSLAPPLYSISQSLRPFHLSMAPRPIHSQNNVNSEIHEPNKVTEFPSK